MIFISAAFSALLFGTAASGPHTASLSAPLPFPHSQIAGWHSPLLVATPQQHLLFPAANSLPGAPAQSLPIGITCSQLACPDSRVPELFPRRAARCSVRPNLQSPGTLLPVILSHDHPTPLARITQPLSQVHSSVCLNF